MSTHIENLFYFLWLKDNNGKSCVGVVTILYLYIYIFISY